MVEAKVPTFWCVNLKHHVKKVDHYHFHLSELAFIQFKPCEIVQHLFQVQPIFCFQLTSLSISPSLAFTTPFSGGHDQWYLWYLVVPSFQSSILTFQLRAALDRISWHPMYRPRSNQLHGVELDFWAMRKNNWEIWHSTILGVPPRCIDKPYEKRGRF